MNNPSAPDHARMATSDSFYADLRRGVRYAFARRQKLIAAAVFLAGVLVSQRLVSGWAAWLCGAILAVAGTGVVNFARYIAPVAKGPAVADRSAGPENRGLAGHPSHHE